MLRERRSERMASATGYAPLPAFVIVAKIYVRQGRTYHESMTAPDSNVIRGWFPRRLSDTIRTVPRVTTS